MQTNFPYAHAAHPPDMIYHYLLSVGSYSEQDVENAVTVDLESNFTRTAKHKLTKFYSLIEDNRLTTVLDRTSQTNSGRGQTVTEYSVNAHNTGPVLLVCVT